jgi:hypothetical protein
MKPSIALTLTLAAMLSSSAFAQRQSPTMPPTSTPPATQPPASTEMQQTPPSAAQAAQLENVFDKLNVSHTGKLTKAEAQAHPVVAANFDAADTNHDGVLTKDEFLAAFKPAQ